MKPKIAGAGESHKMIDVESIVYGQIYAFTLNPDDNRQFWDDPDRIERFVQFHEKYTIKHIYGDMRVMLEISKKGRLHFHGTISWPNRETLLHFFLDSIHTLTKCNTYEVDTITDIQKWNTYITKQNLIIPTQIIQNTHNYNKPLKVKPKPKSGLNVYGEIIDT